MVKFGQASLTHEPSVVAYHYHVPVNRPKIKKQRQKVIPVNLGKYRIIVPPGKDIHMLIYI